MPTSTFSDEFRQVVLGSNTFISARAFVNIDGDEQMHLQRGLNDTQLLLTSDIYSASGDYVASCDVTPRRSTAKGSPSIVHRASSALSRWQPAVTSSSFVSSGPLSSPKDKATLIPDVSVSLPNRSIDDNAASSGDAVYDGYDVAVCEVVEPHTKDRPEAQP